MLLCFIGCHDTHDCADARFKVSAEASRIAFSAAWSKDRTTSRASSKAEQASLYGHLTWLFLGRGTLERELN